MGVSGRGAEVLWKRGAIYKSAKTGPIDPHNTKIATLSPSSQQEVVTWQLFARVLLCRRRKPLGQNPVRRLRVIVLRHMSCGDLFEPRGVKALRALTEVLANRP